jgi:hypothetical protein
MEIFSASESNFFRFWLSRHPTELFVLKKRKKNSSSTLSGVAR